MRTGQTQSLHFWFYFEPALPYGDGQNRNNKYFSLKSLTIEVSKYVKLKALSSLPFPGKLQLIFFITWAIFGRKEGGVTRSMVRIKISLFYQHNS